METGILLLLLLRAKIWITIHFLLDIHISMTSRLQRQKKFPIFEHVWVIKLLYCAIAEKLLMVIEQWSKHWLAI